jgi:tetratricopeptide (TPR) repeat protein
MLDEAKADFTEAIATATTPTAEIFFNRANVHLLQANFVLAHQDLDLAITIDCADAKVHHNKGITYQSQAEQIASLEPRDLAQEDLLVSKAIECFGNALLCDQNFIQSIFH